MTKREVDDAFILQLPPTEHPFHGNHWYHTGEYYLSRMERVHEMIETEFQANVPRVVYLVSANHLLHSMLTHFTFFLLILMVWNPQIQKIHLLETSGSNLRSMMPHSRGQVVAITGSITHSFTYDPFRNNSWIPSNPAIEQTIQGYYLGNIDSHPIPTAEWIQGRTVLQQHIQLLCPKNAVRIPVNSATAPASALVSSDAPLSHTQLRRKKRYLLYQRDQIRRLLNYEHLLPPRPSLPDANGVQCEDNNESDVIHVIQHSDDHGLCDLYHVLNPKGIFPTNASASHTQIDETVFITTHGFQLTALFLLPPQTTVVEVFPYRYFKPSYFPLYPKLGIRHNYFQSQFRTPEAARYLDPIPQVRCLQDKPCRSYARNQDIWLSPDEINLIRHMISIEEM